VREARKAGVGREGYSDTPGSNRSELIPQRYDPLLYTFRASLADQHIRTEHHDRVAQR